MCEQSFYPSKKKYNIKERRDFKRKKGLNDYFYYYFEHHE